VDCKLCAVPHICWAAKLKRLVFALTQLLLLICTLLLVALFLSVGRL
jgi:hypothetical protein